MEKVNEKDFNILVAQLEELQSRINQLEGLKSDIREIKQINELGEDVAKEIAEEVKELRKHNIHIPFLEKQAEKVLYPKKRRTSKARPLLESEIRDALAATPSARQAAKKLGVHYDTYKRFAIMYGLHKTVPPSERRRCKVTGPIDPFSGKFPLNDLLDGKHPKFPVHRLKDKLIRSGLKKAECEMCGCKERRVTDGKIPLLLNFEDGDFTNRKLENLKVYCYNCTFLLGRPYFKRGTINFNFDPDVMQGAKKPLPARH
jgi:hypothetical protein